MAADERSQKLTFSARATLTRRGLFEFAGLAIASSVFPSRAAVGA